MLCKYVFFNRASERRYNLAIRAVTDTYQDHIAIDDIKLTENSCEPVWDNDFENGFQQYQQMKSMANWRTGDAQTLNEGSTGEESK